MTRRKALFILFHAMAGLLAAQAAEWTGEWAFSPDQVSYQSVEGFEQILLREGALAEDEPGTPWIPARYVNILLPSGASALSVSAEVQEIRLRDDVLVYPVQPPQPLSEALQAFTPADPIAYASSQGCPARPAELEGTYHLRGHTFVSVRLNPLRYVPATRELFLAARLALTVEYAQGAPADLIRASSPSPQEQIFSDMVSALVVNPSEMEADSFSDGQPSAAVDYLIITSAALSNSFQSLANYRAAKNNLATQVLTTEHIDATYSGARPSGGSDLQTKIRNCIASYVQDHGVVYVILGGDNTVVPDRDCYVTCSGYTASDMPTDLYYGGLDSSWDENANGVYGEAAAEGDLAYDVIVARIPVRTEAQATNYIGKLMRFEGATLPAGFARKLFVGGDALWNTLTGDSRPTDTVGDGLSEFRSHSPVSDAEVWGRRLWRDAIRAYDATPVTRSLHDTLTSWDTSTAGDYVQSSANMLARLNEGWNHISFNTHGSYTSWGLESGSFSTASADSLTNLTAFVYTMACLTGGFDAAEPSLSEAFLRNARGGALAYMGCSRYGWGSPGSYKGGPSMDFAYFFYRQLYQTRRTTVGLAFAEHKLAQASSSTYNGANRWIQFGLNLQGDPLAPLFKPDFILGNDPFWFRAVGLSNSVALRWPDPYTCGFSNRTVHIRNRTDRYPTNLLDGVQVYQGIEQHFTHSGLANGQPRYYTIWVSQDGASFLEPAP